MKRWHVKDDGVASRRVPAISQGGGKDAEH
jgi:hypothetical protein